MTHFKYQEDFAQQLTTEWLNGDYSGVRTKIRNLKNKAQAAYIAAHIAAALTHGLNKDAGLEFVQFLHPNNQ